ncbi:MAG: hypothetical protein SNI70_08975 [Rikenellaceae bacterium]
MRKIKAGTQEFQNAQQAQQNHPKRKLASLSDVKLTSISKEPKPEPLRKINMSDLVREAEEEYYKNPMFKRPQIPVMQDGCIYGHTLRSLLIKR